MSWVWLNWAELSRVELSWANFGYVDMDINTNIVLFLVDSFLLRKIHVDGSKICANHKKLKTIKRMSTGEIA